MQNADLPAFLRFGPFEVDLARRQLLKRGIRVRLSGKPYVLLIRLLTDPGSTVSREELQRTLWDGGVFVDFDHSLNAIVNRLRAQLDDSAGEQHYIETIPGVGYRFAGTLEKISNGQPAAQLTDQEDNPGLISHTFEPPWYRRHRLVTFVLFAILAAAIAGILLRQRSFYSSPRALVLLPLRNLPAAGSQEFWADGVTDAITTELGRFPDLHLISATSAFSYKNTAKPVSIISRELRVRYLVEGSVTGLKDGLRVDVRLLEAQPEQLLWSRTYNLDSSNAAATEAEIAEAIALRISPRTAKPPKRAAKPVVAEAYELYLKGRYMLAKGTESSTYNGIEYLLTSVQLSPDFPDAHIALAEAYYSIASNYEAPSVALPKARQQADIGLQLDAASSEAHAIRGRLAVIYDWDWRLAESHLKKALELNPSSASAHLGYFDFLMAREKYDQAFAEAKIARELDPVSLANSLELQLGFFDSGNFEALEEYARKALEIDPEFSWSHSLLGWVQYRQGKLEQGINQANRGRKERGSLEEDSLIAEMQVFAGRPKVAEDMLNGLLEQRHKGYVCAHAVASIYSALGRKEDAFKWLQMAYAERSSCLPYLRRDPLVASLRGDARFEDIIRRVQQQ